MPLWHCEFNNTPFWSILFAFPKLNSTHLVAQRIQDGNTDVGNKNLHSTQPKTVHVVLEIIPMCSCWARSDSSDFLLTSDQPPHTVLNLNYLMYS